MGLEYIAEIRRSCSKTAVHDDIAFHVQRLEMGAEIIPCRFNGDSIGRDRYVVEPLGCTTVDQDKDGPDNIAATELRAGFHGYNLTLVGIVVKDGSKLFEIFFAQGPADRLGNAIGHTVRVSETLALNKFNLLFF